MCHKLVVITECVITSFELDLISIESSLNFGDAVLLVELKVNVADVWDVGVVEIGDDLGQDVGDLVVVA